MRARVIVTGATGLLGPYILDAARAFGRCWGLARSGADICCDLTDAAAVRAAFHQIRPDAVIHSAAYTDVDGCERDPALSDRVNRLGSANVAAAMRGEGSLLYVSTDQVYPDSGGPHAEHSVAPVNVYGRSKAAGEAAVLAGHPRVAVVRTNLFGPARVPTRRSLSDFVSDALRESRPITLFRDVLFSPLHVATFAGVLFEMLEKNVRGIFNVGSRNGMSKRDFGFLIAAHLGLPTNFVSEGDSTSVSGRAPRPRDLRMDVMRIEAALGRAMPSCDEEVRKL